MTASLRRGKGGAGGAPLLPFGAGKMHNMLGLPVPDPITFVVGERWCNRPQLYPRQATLLKIIFLRDDLFTDYDYEVIAEWEREFAERGKGICPQILTRITYLKAMGYRWFREVLLVMGRRAGKGYIAGLAMAYIIWCYMAKGDPQEAYGIDPDKQLACFVFAVKKDSAIKNLWGDLNNVITNAPCFADHISKPLGTSLSVHAPGDALKEMVRLSRGVDSSKDSASFLIEPKESSPTAARGPAGCLLAFDEMGHVTKTVAKADAADIYTGATPALDQFGKDGFIVAPSSPWEKIGKFYELVEQALEMDLETGLPVYMNKMMLQLESWAIYYDWERWDQLDLLPPGFQGDLGEYASAPLPRFVRLKGAIQAYDEQMKLEERANPDTFAVERRADWATVMDAYLNAKKVDEVFDPWAGRLPDWGPPVLQQQAHGLMHVSYKAHGDPAEVNCTFGFSLAHVEPDRDGLPHVVFDLIKHWDPADAPGHILDYDEILKWIFDNAVLPFQPSEVTFDQWNSIASVRGLQKLVRDTERLTRRVEVYEKTATNENNWQRYEQLKAAINLGRVHAPLHLPSHSHVRDELKYLIKAPGRKVVAPDSGPVTTKDTADTMMEVVSYLIGDQLDEFVRNALRNQRVGGAMQSPGRPLARDPDADTFSRMAASSRPSGRVSLSPPGRPRRR